MSSPSIVKLARVGDEAKIFDFFCEAHHDNGFFPISSKKVIDMIMRGCKNEGASIGLIRDQKGNIEAASGLILECAWYSDTWFLSELLNYVAEAHRRSGHAKALLKFQKDTAVYLSRAMGYNVPVIPGILTRKRLEPKMRLFQREFQQVGALFVFNAADYIKPDDEFFNQRKIENPKAIKFHDPQTVNADAYGDRNAPRRKVMASMNGAP